VVSSVRFVFGPFELEPAKRRLTAAGEPVAISDRHLEVLLLLVARAGHIVAKDDLIEAGWKDVAVGDNSIEQAVSSLRRTLGEHPSGSPYIETVPRRGYRFGVEVTRTAARESDEGLGELLAPHRAFIEGRAALETLEGERILQAREVFEKTLRDVPEHSSAHLGLANACVMQFEMTRADPDPDQRPLELAAHHAREACRLDPRSGEAWATLGFVLHRVGGRMDALAASKRATMLEPDNWRHHLRLGSVSWGEERLRAAHRVLALLPNLPLAHWLAATVHVARGAFIEAQHELSTALTAAPALGDSRFSLVALHWLAGLLHLANGDENRALEQFEAELALEATGHLYARECCANTWYAIGALRLRQRRSADAAMAFEHAIARVAMHPLARVGLESAQAAAAVMTMAQGPSYDELHENLASDSPRAFEAGLVQAARLAVRGAHARAAHVINETLAGSARGDAGWHLPVEPLLHVSAHPDIWAQPLALLRQRAA
jgi:DNA-binding winged helix-turn-helix (wHTH) protein